MTDSRFRAVLNEGSIIHRVKDKYKDNPILPEGLNLGMYPFLYTSILFIWSEMTDDGQRPPTTDDDGQ